MEKSDHKLIRNEKQKQRYEPQQQQQKEDYSDDHTGALPTAVKHRKAHEKQRRAVQGLIGEVEQVKLAATAISLNVRMRSSSNMPHYMQDRALRRTRSLLDSTKQSSVSPKTHPNATHLARALKKEFDSLYGPAWHCVVGKSFGSFVTHSPGGFLYFSIDDSLSVLLFKTEVQLVAEQQEQA